MNQLELLLPFGLPPKEMARDLLRELKMPALSMLLARSGRRDYQTSDGFARALPHEIWLAQQFGLHSATAIDTSPSLAVDAMHGYGLTPEAGVWFVLQPVHLHVARDHLVLTDTRQLKLIDADARTLFDIARPLFEESGNTLLYGDAQTWFLRADDWHALQTSTPDAACGHNIDIWMPKGEHERAWRRLQNEIQMHWYEHAVNDAREARGLKPVNSIWLWGAAVIQPSATDKPASEQADKQAEKYIKEAFIFPHARNLFSACVRQQIAITSASDLVAAKPQHGLLIIDNLIEAALAGDWSEWLGRFQMLETDWFAPLLDAIKDDQLEQLTLTFSHNTALSTSTTSKSSLRKFWHQPSLARLAA